MSLLVDWPVVIPIFTICPEGYHTIVCEIYLAKVVTRSLHFACPMPLLMCARWFPVAGTVPLLRSMLLHTGHFCVSDHFIYIHYFCLKT